jgi:hypothetical protein
MPTNNKTSLGFNRWLGTDKPKRSDFVEDNTLLDTLLTGHFGDAAKHLSAADRTRLEQGFTVGTYTGDGLVSQDITLPFEAKIVFVFFQRKPAYFYQPSGQYYENNFTVATTGGAMLGVYLDKAVLTVCQTLGTSGAGDTVNNFNRSGSSYTYIAFR